MKTRTISIILFTLIAVSASSQKYFTKGGNVTFESDAPIERIEAFNDKALCVWDTETAAVQVSVLIKSFRFDKALMQEHFNENYLESEKYPKAIFKGTITNMDKIDVATDGNYTGMVEGELTMHGVTNPIATEANLIVSGSDIKCLSTFDIEVADYEIKIPNLVKDNIAKVVKVMIDMDLKPLEK